MTKLNEDQKRAVAAALNKTRPLVTICGPPGTGKTAVIAEIIAQAVMRKQKVFYILVVCACTGDCKSNSSCTEQIRCKTCDIVSGTLSSFFIF